MPLITALLLVGRTIGRFSEYAGQMDPAILAMPAVPAQSLRVLVLVKTRWPLNRTSMNERFAQWSRDFASASGGFTYDFVVAADATMGGKASVNRRPHVPGKVSVVTFTASAIWEAFPTLYNHTYKNPYRGAAGDNVAMVWNKGWHEGPIPAKVRLTEGRHAIPVARFDSAPMYPFIREIVPGRQFESTMSQDAKKSCGAAVGDVRRAELTHECHRRSYGISVYLKQTRVRAKQASRTHTILHGPFSTMRTCTSVGSQFWRSALRPSTMLRVYPCAQI